MTRRNLWLEPTLEHVHTRLHADRRGVKIGLRPGEIKGNQHSIIQAFNSRPSWIQSSPSAQQTCERAILGRFHPPHPPTSSSPSNHTPTSLATSRRALSSSIVPFSQSLTLPASSLDFLPAVTVYSSLSCFSTSVPCQARYVSAVYQNDERQHSHLHTCYHNYS